MATLADRIRSSQRVAFGRNDGMADGGKATGNTAAIDGMGSSSTDGRKPAVADFGCPAAGGNGTRVTSRALCTLPEQSCRAGLKTCPKTVQSQPSAAADFDHQSAPACLCITAKSRLVTCLAGCQLGELLGCRCRENSVLSAAGTLSRCHVRLLPSIKERDALSGSASATPKKDPIPP